jgi:hypothetical protein
VGVGMCRTELAGLLLLYEVGCSALFTATMNFDEGTVGHALDPARRVAADVYPGRYTARRYNSIK